MCKSFGVIFFSLIFGLFNNHKTFSIRCKRVCVGVCFQPAKEVDPGPRESVLQFVDKDLLPLRDVAVFSSSSLSHEFGFTLGPVCFSQSVNERDCFNGYKLTHKRQQKKKEVLYYMRMKGRPVGCTSCPLQSSLHVNDTLRAHIFTGALQQTTHRFLFTHIRVL